MPLNDYTAGVIALVQVTQSNRDGITIIVEAAETAIINIDNDIATLVSQRAAVAGIYRQFVEVYRIVTSEVIRSREQVDDLIEQQSSTETDSAENLRTRILALADKYERDHSVQVSRILRVLKQTEEQIPWQNPAAVIGTMLGQSGRWRRVEEGVYEETTEEDAD